MHDVFNRLYRTKVILSCLVLVGVGIILLVMGRNYEGDATWMGWMPWGELGGILVGAGILGVLIDAYLSREQAEIDEIRTRRLFREEAPAMVDAVIGAFAAGREDLQRVATPELLDNLVTNSLALRLGDEQFAAEIYTDIRDQAIGAAERWHDAQLSIELRPLTMVRGVTSGNTPPSITKDFFTVTVRWEYVTTPSHAQRRFVCLSDREEYAELAHERGATSAWFFPALKNMDAGDPRAFELQRFTVDGEERPIRRSTRKNAQTYTVAMDPEIIRVGKPVTIAYTYQAVMAASGNHLFFDIEQPTRDLRVDFDHTGCNIAKVNVLDLMPSIRPTRIETPIEGSGSETIRLDIDGWVFPRSGVAFVWSSRLLAPLKK